jgi:acetylornithine/succinyldiaminopimelate/putrescine aminotransferase
MIDSCMICPDCDGFDHILLVAGPVAGYTAAMSTSLPVHVPSVPQLGSSAVSLADLLGSAFTDAVCATTAFARGVDVKPLRDLANEPIEFFPPRYAKRINELLDRVGDRVVPAIESSCPGAGTSSFATAAHPGAAPLGGLGFLRIGEDGRAYLAAKSEHYHASLGHAFPGYDLIERARTIGIHNPTHNNTRGHAVRTLERELIRRANGIDSDDAAGLDAVLASDAPRVLNRVINLQTGSLAVEAAFKMMLARFYRAEPHAPEPRYEGRTPVFLVVGDEGGGMTSNYHGTTVFTQMMRGMWERPARDLADSGTIVFKAVPLGDIDALLRTMNEYDGGRTKVAGFFHEIILMNYGGIRLAPEYLRRAYEICGEHDVPVAVDEIQSGAWAPDLFLFREYGLTPDFVAVGKGLSGGEYATSRILTTRPLDNLSQFGALVTNGQEELAALACLITMRFLDENRAAVDALGRYYQERLHAVAEAFPALIDRIEGDRHMGAVFFRDGASADRFARELNERCIDVSTHSYKADSVPSALTKLPLVATREMIDYLVTAMIDVLEGFSGSR